MKLDSQRVLVTGAGGGIGLALSAQLAGRGARLFLVERNQDAAARLAARLKEIAPGGMALAGDITQAEARQDILRAVHRAAGGVDVLIHLAGMLDFASFAEEDPGMMQAMLKVNVEAPLLLTREVLPGMIDQGRGRVVTVGSMFGSIGFPCFAGYSATKFALRGFSEALRRELAGTGVGVTYVSPRAVRTALNPPVVHNMAEQGLMRMDEPQWVAGRIVKALERDARDVYLGFPESFFARLNGLLPRVVDRALIKQVPSLLRFAAANKQT
jgi:short-subunit dehydrogenase